MCLRLARGRCLNMLQNDIYLPYKGNYPSHDFILASLILGS